MDSARLDPAKMKAFAAEYSSSESDGDDDDELQMPSTDPTADEFADFNPRKRRRTGRDAKESAALGIFGSESEDERPGQRWKRRTLRNKGVSFVSSGKKAEESDEDGAADDKWDDENEPSEPATMRAQAADDDDEDEDEDEDEEAGGVGLGFGAASAASGLGWAPSAPPQFTTKLSRTPSKPPMKPKYNDDTPLGQSFTPSSAYEPVLKVQDDAAPPTTPVARPSAFSKSAPGKGSKGKTNPSSFGARMMAKMGYVEGQGLGREGQGRNVIIEANLRPQKAGLGAVKEKTEAERQEEKRQARLRGETVIDSDEEEKKKRAARKKKAFGGRLSSGRDSGASTPRRPKPKYLTLDEVKKAAPGLNIPDAFTPILDLTGPGKKMLTSSSGLMTPTSGAAPAETAEQAESRKLVRRAQNDFMAILEEWQGLQERKAFAELQLQQERQELDELQAGLDAHQGTAKVFHELQDATSSLNGESSLDDRWDRTITLLQKANESITDAVVQAVKDEVTAITIAAVHPMFKEYLQTWDPLQEPNPRFAVGLQSIRGMLGLEGATKHHRRSVASPYEAMMYKVWLPQASRAVREWSVRDSDKMIAVFEAWNKLLPGFIRAQFLEQDIVRKLDEAVAKWEPKRKKHHSLPHLWLFPWLQYLPYHHLDPKSSTGLVADVKRKFRQLIDVWEYDRGVIPGLKQWKDILRPSKSNDQWQPLVMNHLLPSMARYLRKNFRVDPSGQEPYLPMLSGIFAWLELVPAAIVAEVLVAEVFPMWHDVLYQWLVMDDPNYEEIGQWFEWWQEQVLPAEIRDLPSIVAEFDRGTALIDETVTLGEDAKTQLAPPKKGPALEVKRDPHHKHRQAAAQVAPLAPEPEKKASFRDVVEDWCQENDLQLIPERKKVHTEGPLYRITARGDGKGGVLGYFKGDRLHVPTKDGVQEFAGGEQDWNRLMTLLL